MLSATLLWEWALVCPIAVAAAPPALPSARARARMPSTSRARADLGGLRCADNLRCAPLSGPLEGVPFHNEVRVSMGEGPLIDDMDIGSSRTEKLLLRRYLYGAFGPIAGKFFRTCPCKLLRQGQRCHMRNISL